MPFIYVVPGPPESFTVQVLNYTTVRLTWLPPTSPNGVILLYTIMYNGTRQSLNVSDYAATITVNIK